MIQWASRTCRQHCPLVVKRHRRKRWSAPRDYCPIHDHGGRSHPHYRSAAQYSAAFWDDGGDGGHLRPHHHLRANGNRDSSDRPAGNQHATRHRGYRAHDTSIHIRYVRDADIREDGSIHDYRVGHVDTLYVGRTITIRRHEDFAWPEREPAHCRSATDADCNSEAWSSDPGD